MGHYQLLKCARSPYPQTFILPVETDDLAKMRIPGITLPLLTILHAEAQDSDVVDIEVSVLSERLGKTNRAVNDALQKLVELGFVLVLSSEDLRGNISDVLRWSIFKRDHYTCHYCGTNDGPFVVDHVVPVIKGGPSIPSNLVTSCQRCNRQKSDKDYTEFTGKIWEGGNR